MQALRVGPLVRAVSATSAAIWVETFAPCTVLVQVQTQDDNDKITGTFGSPDIDSEKSIKASAATTKVGGRFFAVVRLEGLQAATWYTYTYSLTPVSQIQSYTSEQDDANDAMRLCFRTFATDAINASGLQELRIAYGSCRKVIMPETDAFNALGGWLIKHYEEREQIWPHVLLLIGDQIYADEPGDKLIELHPHLRKGASTFEDFSQMYEYTWTCEPNVRQVLAALPTYMILDDHDITNGLNSNPLWRRKMLETGLEQVLVDGMVAYWVYQGWGNLAKHDEATSPLLSIMNAAVQNDEDALVALRAAIRDDVYQQVSLSWHYEIATTPAIFVTNARTERTSVLDGKDEEVYGPMRIMSDKQTDALLQWIRAQHSPVALVVSSVPLLLPPVIGMAEYVMGSRVEQNSRKAGSLREWARKLTQFQKYVAVHTDFDHWPHYNISWKALIDGVIKRTGSTSPRDLVVFSGDVHFSYAIEGKRPFAGKKSPRIYQLVSTPMQNSLDAPSERKIRYQSHISQLFYGGLLTRMLPMQALQKRTSNIEGRQLFQNTIALVTLKMRKDGYKVRQEYLGITENGGLEVIVDMQVKV